MTVIWQQRLKVIVAHIIQRVFHCNIRQEYFCVLQAIMLLILRRDHSHRLWGKRISLYCLLYSKILRCSTLFFCVDSSAFIGSTVPEKEIECSFVWNDIFCLLMFFLTLVTKSIGFMDMILNPVHVEMVPKR